MAFAGRMCVCDREGGGERERERKTEKERGVLREYMQRKSFVLVYICC
jgi:hypothetical protein